MNFFRSVVIMMSLYTKIPVPLIEWNEKNLRYVLTVLPLSGLLIGVVEAAWLVLSLAAGIHAPLYSAAACGIPLLLNGGIHMDGLADTLDACASYSSPEKKREILRDPHIGAFGVSGIVIYELVTFGIFSEIYAYTGKDNAVLVFSLLILVFIVPRMLVQIAVALIPPAVPGGMLFTLTSVSGVRLNLATALVLLAVCMSVVSVQQGWDALVYIASVFLIFFYFRRMALRQFGGISGDLCGWLIKISETVILAAVCITLFYL